MLNREIVVRKTLVENRQCFKGGMASGTVQLKLHVFKGSTFQWKPKEVGYYYFGVLVAHAYSTEESFKNIFALMSRYFVDISVNFGLYS